MNIEEILHPDDHDAVAKKFSLQADKVMKHLSRFKNNNNKNDGAFAKKDRNPKEKIRAVIDTVDKDDIFRQYDVHRRGIISYDDFRQIITSSSSGFTAKDTDVLLQELDKNSTGVIRYEKIVDNLKGLDARLFLTKQPQKQHVASVIPSTDVSGAAVAAALSFDQGSTTDDFSAPRSREMPLEVAAQSKDDIINVEVLDPSFNSFSPLKTQGKFLEQYAEISERGRNPYNPSFFGGDELRKVFHLQREPFHIERENRRATSAPPLGRRAPKTTEGSAQIQNRLRNDYTAIDVFKAHVVHSTRNKEHSEQLKMNEPANKKSLLSYLSSSESVPSIPKPRKKAATAPSIATQYFSAEQRKQRQIERSRRKLEEENKESARNRRIQENVIISQTNGNLKPLQVLISDIVSLINPSL